MADLGLPRTYNQLEIVVEDSIANAPKDTGESRVRPSPGGPAVGGSAPAELVRLSDDLQSKLSRRGVAVGAVQVRRSDEHWATDVVNAMMTILIGMGSFSLVLSGFLVINTISGLLAQQKRQIGMLKVVGSTTGQVTGVYMVTVASYGVLALLVALPLGQGLARAFLILVVSVLNFDILTFHLPFGIFLMEVVVALIVPLLAALFPILNAARMTAAAAISDYVIRPQSDPIDRTLARLSGLSTPMMLSVRNTFRHRTRLLLTLVTLVLAGMLFVSVFNVRYGLGIELGNMMSMSDFDVQLILGGSYNRAGLERRAEQIPGVTQAEGWAAAEMQRVRPGGDLGQTFTLYGVRHDSVFVNPILVEGRWLEEGDQYAIVVSSELLRDETGVHLGDDLTLELDDETHDWQVVGIIESSQPTAYAPFDTVSRVHGTADQTGMLLVRTEDRDAASLDSVAEALDTHLELRNLTVIRSTTQDELMSFVTGGFNILTMILLGIAILVAAVGGLGLAGMMSLNVLERTREIGVLRAVGAANGPIRRIVLIEGMVVGLLSWLLALPLSVPASRVFGAILGQTMLGRPLPFVYGLTGPVVWLAIVLTISAVASLMPAQRASRISVREALAYE
jgi:putative ABC transport system permease protein